MRKLVCIMLDEEMNKNIILDITDVDNVKLVDCTVPNVSLDKGITEVVEDDVVQYFGVE